MKIAGSVAKNVIGRLHLEQIRTGGLSFAAQIIAKMPEGMGHNRRMLRGVHLGATTGLHRKLAGSCDKAAAIARPSLSDRGQRDEYSRRGIGAAAPGS